MKKISLIISGGVSLGAYEAGAITELLYALEYLNRKESKFEIDVITGASAGSIATALTAKVIFHNYSKFKDILYESWVKKADISSIMQGQDEHAILSNHFLFKLANGYLTRQEEVAPASCASETMRCGFSLTNQVGIDYGLPYKNAPKIHFSSTFFSDFVEFTIERGGENDRAFWETIAKSAIASGSFPLVFPPVFLMKSAKDFPHALISSLSFLPSEIGYVDGGIFNNDPLKLAITLSREQDGNLIQDDRIFILIDPSINASLQDRTFTRPQPFHLNALRTVALIMGESRARDWLKMQETNTKIAWRDDFIRQLPSFLNSLSEEALSEKLEFFSGQVQAVLEGKKAKRDHYEKSITRIREYYQHLYREIEEKRHLLFENMVFVLNHTASLDTKFPLNFYIISSESGKMGGDPYFSFGGFFKEEWREHDFRLGRSDAFKAIPEILGVSPYPKEGGLRDYNPLYDPDPSWGDVGDETIADAPRESREVFADLIAKKADLFLQNEPLHLSGIKLWIAKKAFNTLIKKSLKLPEKHWYNPFSWFR